MRHSLLLTSFITILICNNLQAQKEFSVLKGPYLGQETPGMIPKVFAPGILNNDKTGAFCTVFSKNGNEFYCTLGYKKRKDLKGGITQMRRVKNLWTKPEVLSFNSTFDENDVCMSYDENKLIFRSWRPLPDGTVPERSFLWYAERTNTGWGAAKPLFCGGKSVRTGYPSIAKNDNLYFAHKSENKSGIYCTKLINDSYDTPKHVYSVLDSIHTEGDMFVAPDESYMIISCYNHPEMEIAEENFGDLFIIFKNKTGLWSKAIKMGKEINTKLGENCPQISPDGKYLFFHRYNIKTRRSDIYWVDAKVIENLKPDYLK